MKKKHLSKFALSQLSEATEKQSLVSSNHDISLIALALIKKLKLIQD